MEELLKNLGDDAPSGENLEYESVFAELELAAQPGEERQAGDEIIPAEPPNDGDIIEKGLAVLEQSHDLRAAVFIGGAELRTNGFEGFAKATSYVRGCLEQYWDTCHPQLDDEDDNDPTMRVNTILGLCNEGTMVKLVRRAPMTFSNAFGRVSLRDIAVADGEVAPSESAENILDHSGISAAFRDTDAEKLLSIFNATSQVLEDFRTIDAVFDEKIPGLGPDMSLMIKTMQRIVARLGEETGADLEDVSQDGEDVAEGGVAKAAAPTGAIASRQDVETAIDRILTYYTVYEPSSPIPLILERAKRLVGADFMTIVNDMAIDGLPNVKLVGGIVDEE